jgi:hypothetical protein
MFCSTPPLHYSSIPPHEGKTMETPSGEGEIVLVSKESLAYAAPYL